MPRASARSSVLTLPALRARTSCVCGRLLTRPVSPGPRLCQEGLGTVALRKDLQAGRKVAEMPGGGTFWVEMPEKPPGGL